MTADPKQPAAPCKACGYDGPNFDQPDHHSCVAGLSQPATQESEVEKLRAAGHRICQNSMQGEKYCSGADRCHWSGHPAIDALADLAKRERDMRQQETERADALQQMADIARKDHPVAGGARRFRPFSELRDGMSEAAQREITERANTALVDMLIAAEIEIEQTKKERDEARQLHDEHCMGRLESDGSPLVETAPTCVPPWGLR